MRESLRSDWHILPLEEVARIIDCPHSTPELTSDGPFVARSQDVRSGIFRMDLAAHVSDVTYQERIKRAEPGPGDLLFSREGTYFGIAAEVPSGVRVCLGQRMVLIRPSTRVNTRFLRYWLNSPLFGDHATGFHDGSVAQRLNVATIRRLPVPVPAIAEQRIIAGMLGVLDDKIELNRRTNRTLKTTTTALFRSWFVDFEPVAARAEARRAVGVPAAVQEEMPTGFVEAAEGVIPEGWRWETMGKVLSVTKVGLLPNEAPGSIFDHYSIPAFDDGELPARELGATIRSGKFRVPDDAILVSKLNPYTPRIWWPAPTLHERSVCSTEFIPCVPRLGIPREFLYELLRSSSFADEMATLVTGTSNSHQRVKPEDFLHLLVVVPSESVARAFAGVVGPLLERSRHNLLENAILATLRDTLLTQILSGTISLRDAEETAATVA